MTDKFTRQRSERLVALYARYRGQLDATKVSGRWMPYNWWTLPDLLGIIWMPYSQMLAEYATELANMINDLTHNVHRLRAWDAVIANFPVDDKHEATHEFIDVLGTVALGQPYAIKSRFAYAAGHLSHQPKDPMGWKDEFPNKNLYLNDIDPYGAGWKKYRPFKLRVEPIAGRSFKDASDDFRNAYNHGFSSRFVLGMTGTVTRTEEGDRVSYGFGGNEPLAVDDVGNLLQIERDWCYRSFYGFQALVAEQIGAITAFESERNS